MNPDLAGTVDLGSALLHYLQRGAAEDRAPNGWFDDDFYRASNADLAGLDDATLFMHFNLHGVWEGRAPSGLFATFDGQRYLDDNPDVAAYVHAHLDDFLGSVSNGAIAHFLVYGVHEARAGFDDAGQRIDPDLFF